VSNVAATESAEPGQPQEEAVTSPISEPRVEIAITDPVPVPLSSEINDLRLEIDQLDADILRLIQRRTEVSQRIGAIRRAEGGPRIVLSREQAVLARFRDLGPEGRELGMMLLRLGRGRLGRA
jgi:chorismate mutase